MSKKGNTLLIGLLISILFFASLMIVLTSEPFPRSQLSHSEIIPTKPFSDIGGAMSRFLWDFRGLDLSFQTLIILTTAICCLTLLRKETEG